RTPCTASPSNTPADTTTSWFDRGGVWATPKRAQSARCSISISVSVGECHVSGASSAIAGASRCAYPHRVADVALAVAADGQVARNLVNVDVRGRRREIPLQPIRRLPDLVA